MATRMRDALMQRLGELRFEPTEKQVRVEHDGRTVAQTPRAVLVWEPRRVIPEYAFQLEHVEAELVPVRQADQPAADDSQVLHPGIPFSVHSTPGEVVDVVVGDQRFEQAGFRPSDPELEGVVILDFAAFESWYEEAEEIIAHPRDPYHRVDVRPSDRHVRVELEGEVIAESSRPMVLFETGLPPRFYLPVEDVAATYVPSPTRSACPYKGWASYWSFGDHPDAAWSYEDPFPDALRISGMLSFWGDGVDVIVDDTGRERPLTDGGDTVPDELGAH